MADEEYPVAFDKVSFSHRTAPDVDNGNGSELAVVKVFRDLSLRIPAGVVSFVGQNGTGKSTALLLAAGRLRPDQGSVSLFGTEPSALDEAERNRYASFIYQNMEFETDQPITELFEFVYENGFHEQKGASPISELTRVFELEQSQGRKLQELSKGEMQRAILVFSLLYGSRSVMMDEPIFALEEHQRRAAVEYLAEFSRESATPIYLSLHEIELSRSYADHVVLFFTDGRPPLVGPSEQMLHRDPIEEAFQYPAAMLHQREHLFRERLAKLP